MGTQKPKVVAVCTRERSLEVYQNWFKKLSRRCCQVENCCHFYLLDLYMAKLPVEAKEKDVFYLSPLQKLTKENKS